MVGCRLCGTGLPPEPSSPCSFVAGVRCPSQVTAASPTPNSLVGGNCSRDAYQGPVTEYTAKQYGIEKNPNDRNDHYALAIIKRGREFISSYIRVFRFNELFHLRPP